MASWLASIFDWSRWITELFNFGGKDKRILMLGLDGAGKTTVVYKLKLGETVTTIPTIGFNVEDVQYKNIRFTMWDIGGQKRIRQLWQHYFTGVHGLIWIIDSNDNERIGEARDELHMLVADDLLRDVPVLVWANKQDLPLAVRTSELVDHLGLPALRGRDWYIQACQATSGDGLYEGLDWLSKAVRKRS